MKKLFLPLLFLLAVTCLSSCTTGGTGGELDRDMVLSVLQQFDKALIERDAEVLSSITSIGLTYGHSSGKIQNKEEFIDDVVNGTFQFLSITNQQQSVDILDNVAIVRHVQSAEALNDGVEARVHIGIVMVFKRNGNGGTELIARQAYKLPS